MKLPLFNMQNFDLCIAAKPGLYNAKLDPSRTKYLFSPFQADSYFIESGFRPVCMQTSRVS